MGLFSKLFAKRLPVESAVMTCHVLIPRCIELVHEERFGRYSRTRDADIANISAGIFLFLLQEQLPFSDEANTEKMARAFEVMWALVGSVGGDEEGARLWFQKFNDRLIYQEQVRDLIQGKRLTNDPIFGGHKTDYRIKIIINSIQMPYPIMLKDRSQSLDILPYTISSAIRGLVKEFSLV